MSISQALLPMEITSLRDSWRQKIQVAEVTPDVEGPCWLWTGARDKVSGYGRVQINGKCGYVHRAIYELAVGPIPAALHIDHLCRQRACCAPYHLEPTTCKVNCERGSRAMKTHCPQGHPYSGPNLRIQIDKRGYRRRFCRQCAADAMVRFKNARAARRASTWSRYLGEDSREGLTS